MRDKLQSIDGVLQVHAEGGDGGRPASFTVECKLQTDLRRLIAQTIVSQGWGLLELRGVSLSLEDVFINLVEVKKENWSFGNGVAQYVS